MGQLLLVLGILVTISAGVNLFKDTNNKKIISLVFFIGLIMVFLGFFISPKIKEDNKEEISTVISSSSYNKKIDKKEDKIKNSQKELIIATTGLALKDYDIINDTNPKVETWDISKDRSNWIAVTQSQAHARIKAIFKWSGDYQDEATLLYLLVDGNEYYNKLP